MDRRTLLSLFAGLGLCTLPSSALAAARIAIIANRKNPTSHLPVDEIEAIFRALKQHWPGGKRILAFNFPAKHALRVDFDRAALHMEPAEVARYWIDQRVRGGQHPPVVVPDAKTMLQVVSGVDAAIGYVLASDVTQTVKVLAEV